MAVIKNGILKRISSKDIDDKGVYRLPEEVTEVAPGAFSSLPNLNSVISRNSETKINKFAFLTPEEYEQPLEYSDNSKGVINLLWLNKSLDRNQRLIFKEKWTSTDCSRQSVGGRKENYGELLNSAIEWGNKNLSHSVIIWYDSEKTTEEQVTNTKQEILRLTGGYNNIQLKDIRDISVVSKNPHIFSDYTGFYFKIDLLKLVLTYHSLANDAFNFSVFADIGVAPMEEKKLFDKTTRAMLTNHGILTNGYENQFIQAEGSSEVIKSLALIINANLHRCWQGLQYSDSKLRNYILSNLFRAVYYDTTHILHFLSYGFKNGQVLIHNENKEADSWVLYEPETHGYMPLGNYFHKNGSHHNFRVLEAPIETMESYNDTFFHAGVDPKDLFKFVGIDKYYSQGIRCFFPDEEIQLSSALKNISGMRGSRKDIEVPFGRDHLDAIPNEYSIPISSLTILSYSDSMINTIVPFSISGIEGEHEADNARTHNAEQDILIRLKNKTHNLEELYKVFPYDKTSIIESISSINEAICMYEQGKISKSNLNDSISSEVLQLSKHSVCHEWGSTLNIILFLLSSLLTLGTANIISKTINGRYTFFDRPTSLLNETKELAKICDSITFNPN